MDIIYQKGQVIKLDNKELRVEKVVGRGASSVVYLTEDIHQGTQHLIKEYNPKYIKLSRGDDSSIYCNDEDKEKYIKGLQKFEMAKSLQVYLRKKYPELTNNIANIQFFEKAYNTAYIDMTFFEGETFDNTQEPSLLKLLLRIKTICKTVSFYHDEGYLYLDLKPENVFFMNDTDDISLLFDFDSVIRKDEIKNSTAFYYTKSWSAPEQILGQYGLISEAADIFSIGEMLFFKLFARHSKDCERRSFSRYDFMESVVCKKVSPLALDKLSSVLKSSICLVRSNRYSSLHDFIDDLDCIINMLNQKTYLVNSNVNICESFMGRNEYIEQVISALDQQQVVCVNGIGGIGKTEIVKKVAGELITSKKKVIYSVYNGDWFDLVVNGISRNIANFSRYEGNSEDELIRYYNRVIDELKVLVDSDTIIVIDNIDSGVFAPHNKCYAKDLFESQAKILLTSREKLDVGMNIYVGAIGDENILVELFYKWSQTDIDVESTKSIKRVIDMVQGHTLALELIAKQCYEQFISPQSMLEKLASHDFGDYDVGIFKDEEIKVAKPLNIITYLFKLSDLDDDMKSVLYVMSIVPVFGVKGDFLRAIISKEENNVLGKLIRSGWLIRDGNHVRMHPVISESVKSQYEEKLKCINDHAKLIHNVVDEIDMNPQSMEYNDLPAVIQSFYNEISYQGVVSESIIKLFNLESWVDIINESSYVEKMYSFVENWCEHNNTFFEYKLNNMLNLVYLYISQTKLTEANTLLDDAEEYADRYNLVDFKYQGKIYYYRGWILSEDKDNNTAVDYYLKAYSIKPILELTFTDKLLYADILCNIGDEYYTRHELEKAYQYYRESLERLSLLFDKPNAHFAIRYSNLGRIFFGMWGENGYDPKYLKQSEEYFYKAYNILLKTYGNNSHRIVHILNRLSELHEAKEEYEKAVGYARESYNIIKSYYGEKCLDYARCCISLAEVLPHIKLIEDSENLYKNAINVVRFLKDNGQIKTFFYEADYIFRLGCLYEEFERYDEALELFNQANKLFKNDEVSHIVYIARTLYWMGILYENTNNIDDAIKCFEQALNIFNDKPGCQKYIIECEQEIKRLSE